jgi:hypothetical protein
VYGAEYEALRRVVEEECESDAEFEALMTRVPADRPVEERYATLALVANDVIKARVMCSRLEADILIAARRAVATGKKGLVDLASVLARVDAHAARTAELETRRGYSETRQGEPEERAATARMSTSFGFSEPDDVRWVTWGGRTAIFRRESLALGIMVIRTPGRETCDVAAVEAPANECTSLEKFFENHAHKVLGENVDPAEGVRLAEDYARAWCEGKGPPLIGCTCGEIAAPATTAVH